MKKNNKQKPIESEASAKKIDWKELFRYIIIGGLTTILNWGSAILFTEVFNWREGFLAILNTVLAWIISIVFFAFWAYKIFVFRSKAMKKDILIPEFVSFVLARLLTLGVEAAIVGIGTGLFGLTNTIHFGFTRCALDSSGELVKAASNPDNLKVMGEFVDVLGQFGFYIKEIYIVKFFATVVITILNYIFSKLIIFKPKSKEEKAIRDTDSKPSKSNDDKKAEVTLVIDPEAEKLKGEPVVEAVKPQAPVVDIPESIPDAAPVEIPTEK